MNKKELKREEKRINEILIKSIIATYSDLTIARKNYEFAEEELIDYYLYEIKANQAKLNYFIKKAKQKGIELNRIEKIKVEYLEENQVG